MTKVSQFPRRTLTARALKPRATGAGRVHGSNLQFFADRNWTERAKLKTLLLLVETGRAVLTPDQHQSEARNRIAGRIAATRAKIMALDIALSLRVGIEKHRYSRLTTR